MTHSEAVSKTIAPFRLLNKDQHISRRMVLRILRDIVKTWISQRLLDRSIQQDYNLYNKISCFEFTRIESVKCPAIEFRRCKILMRSKKPLPELIYSKVGASIKDVVSVDGVYEFTQVDEKQYRRNQNRKFKIDSDSYVYIGSDLHLYIPDEEIYAADLNVITLKTEELPECSSCKEPDDCKSGWDYEFICPDKILKNVFDEAMQIVANTYKIIIPDQTPNNIDGL